MPFSICRLPVGTTRLEFVTSGRSVAISEDEDGHSPARASAGAAKRSAKVVPKRILRRILVKTSRNGTCVILRLWWIFSDLYHRCRAFIPGAIFLHRIAAISSRDLPVAAGAKTRPGDGPRKSDPG